MAKNCLDNESPLVALKRRSARQRWEVFHRAISYAKKSNSMAVQDAESKSMLVKPSVPIMKVVK